jgi:hypothetical protein
MQLRLEILALSLLLLVGCASTNLYVIEKQDFFEVKEGTSIGNETTDRHGYFLSDLYMNKVVEARVKK